MDPVTGNIVGNGIDAGSNILGNIINWLSGNDANEQNRRLMEQQNQWAQRMWQLNNEYNSPSAQMARLRAAGINPALAYANGVENVSTSTAETADAPTMRPNIVQPFQMDPNSLAQNDVLRAQADLFRADAADKLGDTDEAKQRIYLLGKEAAKYQSDIDLNVQKVQESLKQIEVLDEEKKKKIAETAHIHWEELQRSDEWKTEKKHIEAMIRELNSQARVNNANAKLVEDQTFWLVQLSIAKASDANYESLVKQFEAEIKNEEATQAILKTVDMINQVEMGEITVEKALAELSDIGYYRANRDGNVFLRGIDLITHFLGNIFGGAIPAMIRR